MNRDSENAEAPHSVDLTVLLNRMQLGDSAAGDRAAAIVYDQLHRIAANAMSRERPGHALQTTELVHEAYLKLLGSSQDVKIEDRGHFFAMAARQMRRILIDYARASQAVRHGGGAIIVDTNGVSLPGSQPGIDLVQLNDCLNELERVDPRSAQVVELRFFGGYTDHEVVEIMGTSLSSVRREWEFARAWLFERMRGTSG